MAKIWETETSKWRHRNHARACFLNLANSYSGDFLEIGPGNGRVMKELSNKKSVTGLEIDSDLIRILSDRNLNAVKGAAENMPFENESFDVVLCEEVIEHIVNQKVVIKEVSIVMRSNVIAIFTTPNKFICRTLMF